MNKVPKRHMDQFTMFLSVVGFTAKTNADGSITCINPKMPKERRQIVLWQNGKMNKACQLLWWDFLNHWLLIGKQFIEALNKKIEVARWLSTSKQSLVLKSSALPVVTTTLQQSNFSLALVARKKMVRLV